MIDKTFSRQTGEDKWGVCAVVERRRAPDRHSVGIVWMTGVLDGRERAIFDDRFASGHRTGRERYVAVCGHLVTPGGLASPPGGRCAGCEAELTARPAWPRPRVPWPRALLAGLRRSA